MQIILCSLSMVAINSFTLSSQQINFKIKRINNMPFFCDCTGNGKDVDGEVTDASENSFETMITFSEEAEPDNNLSENLCSASGKT